jgi:hypothetical protein
MAQPFSLITLLQPTQTKTKSFFLWLTLKDAEKLMEEANIKLLAEYSEHKDYHVWYNFVKLYYEACRGCKGNF